MFGRQFRRMANKMAAGSHRGFQFFAYRAADHVFQILFANLRFEGGVNEFLITAVADEKLVIAREAFEMRQKPDDEVFEAGEQVVFLGHKRLPVLRLACLPVAWNEQPINRQTGEQKIARPRRSSRRVESTSRSRAFLFSVARWP